MRIITEMWLHLNPHSAVTALIGGEDSESIYLLYGLMVKKMTFHFPAHLWAG